MEQDYSKRARDYNEKKARLKILRQKAAERNPDEFYFGMIHGRTHDKGQKLADRGNKSLSHAAVTLLKTQDAGYLRTMLQQTRKERDRLEQEVVLGAQQLQDPGSSRAMEVSERRKGTKIKYVDSPDSYLPPSMEEGAPKEGTESIDQESLRELRAARTKKRKARAARVSKLIALREREAALAEAEQELNLQRAKMSNNIGGVNKNGVKWKVKGRKR